LLGHLESAQLTELVHLLELARKRDETPLSCTGEKSAGFTVPAHNG